MKNEADRLMEKHWKIWKGVGDAPPFSKAAFVAGWNAGWQEGRKREKEYEGKREK